MTVASNLSQSVMTQYQNPTTQQGNFTPKSSLKNGVRDTSFASLNNVNGGFNSTKNLFKGPNGHSTLTNMKQLEKENQNSTTKVVGGKVEDEGDGC